MRKKIYNGEIVYVKHPIEEAVFKFIPKDEKIYVFAKSIPKGDEYSVDEQSNFATDAWLEGEEITQEEYKNF
ncbi:MAG: hypothetical protein WAZ98_03240 [Cyclobacteriaceae bacterium]